MTLAVAISPDGKTIACGGWTVGGNKASHSIYLFDRESGKLIQRIGDLSYNLSGLAYSKDCRFLGAGNEKGGIIYEPSIYFMIERAGYRIISRVISTGGRHHRFSGQTLSLRE
jgi:hypothetical protein